MERASFSDVLLSRLSRRLHHIDHDAPLGLFWSLLAWNGPFSRLWRIPACLSLIGLLVCFQASNTYIVEYAKSGRAKCKDSKCKKTDQALIGKGCVRIGKISPNPVGVNPLQPQVSLLI